MDPNAMQTHPFWQSVRKVKTRILQMFSAEMPAWMFFLDFLVYPPLILLCVVLAFGPGGGFASGGSSGICPPWAR